MAMLFSCNDNYERVGVEAKKAVYPQGVANNLVFYLYRNYRSGKKRKRGNVKSFGSTYSSC